MLVGFWGLGIRSKLLVNYCDLLYGCFFVWIVCFFLCFILFVCFLYFVGNVCFVLNCDLLIELFIFVVFDWLEEKKLNLDILRNIIGYEVFSKNDWVYIMLKLRKLR